MPGLSLPRIGPGQVQQLGRPDPGAAAAPGRALAGAAAQVAQGIQDIERGITYAQERQAGIDMSRAYTQFEEQYGGRDTYAADEIPTDVQVQRTEKQVNMDGTISEVERVDIPAFEVKAQLFEHFLKRSAESAASGIYNDRARADWLARAEQQLNSQYTARLGQARAEQKQYEYRKLVSDINVAVDENNYGLALELARDLSNPEERQQVVKQLKVGRENEYYDSLILDARQDPSLVPLLERAVADLRDEDTHSELSPAQRKAKADRLEGAIDETTLALQADNEQIRQRAVSDTWLAIGANNPAVDEAFVDGLFESRTIDGNTRTRMIQTLREQQNKAMQRQATMIDLDQIAAAGYGIDPKNKQHRQAVDERYDQYIIEAGGDVVASGLRIMQEFQVVPSRIQGLFRAANRADAPNLEQAARLLISAQDFAPQALIDFKQGDIDYIEKVAANMKLGMDLPGAVEQVRAYDALSPDQKQTLKTNASAVSAGNVDVLRDFIDDQPSYDVPWTTSEPDTPAFMATEFNTLVQRNLPRAGFDVNVARRLAFNDLSKNWQITDINGDFQFMKNPPRAPTEEVRASISSTYRGQLGQYTEFYGKQFGPKDVRIAADSRTELDIRGGKKPTYMAYILTDAETQTIEMLPRFEWDSAKADMQRRDRILAEGQEARQRGIEQMERIRTGEIAVGTVGL